MITLKSYGHKFGTPECNFKFDVSFFKNPWRETSIRNENDGEKRKKLAIKFMEKQDGVSSFVDRVASLLRFFYMYFPDENIQVAICCSAGEYRSPIIVEMIHEALGSKIPHLISHSKNAKI